MAGAGQKTSLFWARVWLALAVLAFGLAHIALLPPFEGFDEQAHYSSAREIAALHHIPVYGESRIDAFIEAYAKRGPMSYLAVPPFGALPGPTYTAFAKAAGGQKAYRDFYRKKTERPPYRAGERLNWQAQHPPLYYLLLASLLKVTSGLSFWGELFVLRLFSFLLAFGGLILGSLWLGRAIQEEEGSALSSLNAEAARTAPFLLPFLMPMFFPEFGRIGNDSLCLFLFSAQLLSFQSLRGMPESALRASGFGLLLALGLLTKAFFLPVTFGFAGFLAMRYRAADPSEKQAWRDSLSLAVFPVVLAGFWYVYKLKAFGSLSGGADFISFNMASSSKLALKPLLMGVFGLLQTAFGWTTGSLETFKVYFTFPLILFSLWLWGRFLRDGRKALPPSLFSLPLWILGPVLLGLLGHLIVTVSMTGNSQTPGWYLLIFLPLLAVPVGLAFRKERLWILVLVLYGASFLLANLLTEAAFFSGCLPQSGDKAYPLVLIPACLAFPAPYGEALKTLASLFLAFAAAFCGLFCLFPALLCPWRKRDGKKNV